MEHLKIYIKENISYEYFHEDHNDRVLRLTTCRPTYYSSFRTISLYIYADIKPLDLTKFTACQTIKIYTKNYNVINNIIFPANFSGEAQVKGNTIRCYADSSNINYKISQGQILNGDDEYVKTFYLVFRIEDRQNIESLIYCDKIFNITFTKKYIIVEDNCNIHDEFLESFAQFLVFTNSNRKIFLGATDQNILNLDFITSKISKKYTTSYFCKRKFCCEHTKKLVKDEDGYRIYYKNSTDSDDTRMLFWCCSMDIHQVVFTTHHGRSYSSEGEILINVENIGPKISSREVVCDLTNMDYLKTIILSGESDQREQLLHLILKKPVEIYKSFHSQIKISELEILEPQGNTHLEFSNNGIDSIIKIYNGKPSYCRQYNMSYERYREIIGQLRVPLKSSSKI